MVFRNLATACVAMLGATTLQAQGTMGSLPAGSFGGTGITTESVVVATTNNGVTLGLSAHTRCQTSSLSYATCDMPGPVTNDGVRTFFALAGGNSIVGDAGGSGPATGVLARWNFAFFVGGAAADVRALNYKFSYDFNPAVGNAPTGSAVWNGSVLGPFGTSQNLGFSFLATSGVTLGQITAPTDGPFDPTAFGEYTFRLEAFNQNNESQGYTTMNVSTVPEPSTYLLMAVGLGALAVYRRRRAA